jgi:hypothetical protein
MIFYWLFDPLYSVQHTILYLGEEWSLSWNNVDDLPLQFRQIRKIIS